MPVQINKIVECAISCLTVCINCPGAFAGLRLILCNCAAILCRRLILGLWAAIQPVQKTARSAVRSTLTASKDNLLTFAFRLWYIY